MRFPSKKAIGAALALGVVAAFVIALPAFAATPAITSLSANNVPPGTAITITGTGFTGPNVTSVKFGGTNAPSFVVVSDTSITTSVPCVSAGAQNVVVDNGAASNSQSFTATAPSAVATITSFSPTAGTAGVTSVAITGTNFCNASAVTFNATAATTKTVNSPTSITATVPTGATTGLIHVTTPVSVTPSSSTTNFTVGPPVITSFAPTTALPGAAVTITGSNFFNATAVNFNGVSAVFTVASATSITTTVPATATSGKITVVNAVGTATSTGNFTVGSPAHARTVNGFSFKGNRAAGTVSAGGFNACANFVPVYIQQLKNGHWTLLDTTATNGTGHFSTWVPNKVGKFRATVKKLTLVDGTVCKPGSSHQVHHA